MILLDLLRRYKLSYSAYNFFQKKYLVHNEALYKKYNISKKYYHSISSKDFSHLEEEVNWLDHKNSKEELPKSEVFNALEPRFQKGLIDWSDKGYAILPSFYDLSKISRINKTIDRLLEQKKISWKYGNKLMFAIHHDAFLMDVGTNSRISNILSLLLGRDIQLFQSINFFKGSQQKTHSDSIHMTTFPKGNLTAVWLALEDITMDAGPLHFYPGSHKLPYVLNSDYDNIGDSLKIGDKIYKDYENKIAKVLEENRFEKKQFLAKAGDLLIWHANLLHGGDPQKNEDLTRKSMVFHYYAKEVICYHEISQRPAIIKM